jgi:hypothetical protein
MIDYLRFYVPLKIFSLIWRRPHCRWRAKKLGLCSVLRVLEQGGVSIVPHLLWHGASVIPVSFEGPPPFNSLLRLAKGCGGRILTQILTGPHSVASKDTQGGAEDLFLPGFSRINMLQEEWLTIIWSTSRSSILIFIWKSHLRRWKASNLGLCSALKALSRDGSLSQ